MENNATITNPETNIPLQIFTDRHIGVTEPSAEVDYGGSRCRLCAAVAVIWLWNQAPITPCYTAICPTGTVAHY